MSDKEYCEEYEATELSDPQDVGLGILVFVVFIFIFEIFFVKIVKNTRLLTTEVGVCLIITFIISVMCCKGLVYPPIKKFLRRRDFLKKLGLDEAQAKRRYEFIKYKKLYMPLVQRMCRLNGHPILKQLELLKEKLRSDINDLSEFGFVRDYSDEDYEESLRLIKEKPIEEQEAIIDILFQIAVLEDGIQDDEWELLMEIVDYFIESSEIVIYQRKWKRNKEIYKEKYSAFRRSFANDADGKKKREETQSRESTSKLKKYYSILGLEENASDKEIKQAYHNLALQHHPDLLKNMNRIKECNELMAKINEAYEKIRG